MALAGKAPSTCPGCGSQNGSIVPILYGEHSAEAEDRARRGQAVLGIATGHARAAWECLVCGARLR